MATLQDPVTSQPAGVDPLHKAVRFSLRPPESLGWNSIGAQSGLITGLAANGAVFSFRNLGVNPILIKRVGVGYLCSTVFTTAQKVDFGLFVARAFSGSDTGGNQIAITGSNTKHRTSLATPNNVDMRIAAAAVLTAGTKTLDTNPLGIVGAWVPGAGTIINFAQDNLLNHAAGDHPIVLTQNEGINILNLTAMGAAGVGSFYVNLEFAEVTNY